MSGDDVRSRAAKPAAASSDDLRAKLAELAKYPNPNSAAMTAVLRARMQTEQI